MALLESKIPDENLHIWEKVRTAQSVALNAAKDGVTTNMVDAAARSSLQAAGYGQYFTHRLGHGKLRFDFNKSGDWQEALGIGLEVHEQPYLRGGTSDVIQTGHTFSDEPGVYIEGKVNEIFWRLLIALLHIYLSLRLAYGSKIVFILLKMELEHTLHRTWVGRLSRRGSHEG